MLSKKVAHLCIAAMALPLSGCSIPSYRYEMTVEVDTPEGLRTGSTIVEVDAHSQPWPFPRVIREAHGEPAVIDLGKYGTLFALLRSPQSGSWAANLLPNLANLKKDDKKSAWDQEYRLVSSLIRDDHIYTLDAGPTDPSVESRASRYPLLIRFRDQANFMSAEAISPNDISENFGNGVRIKRITARITSKNPTKLVARYLPWYRDQNDSNKSARVQVKTGFSNSLLSQEDFLGDD